MAVLTVIHTKINGVEALFNRELKIKDMSLKFYVSEKNIGYILRTIHNGFVIGIVLLVFSTLFGCKTTGSDSLTLKNQRRNLSFSSQMDSDGGLVSIFLNLSQPRGPEISFEIISIELQAEGEKLSLLPEPMTVSSKSIGGGQLLIARNSLPSDSYNTLNLKLGKVVIAGKDLKSEEAVNDISVKLNLPASLTLGVGESRSLFVTWDVFSSITVTGGFSPALTVALQAVPFLSDLLFIACPEINTVYTIRTDKNWIISSLGIEGEPTYLAVDPDANRLYVLSPGKSAIKVVDLVTNKEIDSIFIPTGYEPSFMILDPEKEFAYVLDERGRGLVSVDLPTGAIAKRTTLSFQPRYAVFLDWQRKLAVSSYDTHAVYLFDPDNLINSGLLPSGNSPDGLLAWNNFLFIAESGANSVSKYDLSTNRQEESVNVGFNPRRLLVRNNQLYVTNYNSSTISLMFPGQLNISKEIFLKGKPFEMLSTENRLWLYVTDADTGGVYIIDSASNRVSGFIDLYTFPAALAELE